MRSTTVLVLPLVALLAACGEAPPPAATEDALAIRIAYPTTTLINGQLGEVLRRTDVLERTGLSGEVTGFTYGSPMMEAIAAGEVDLAFTSEGPATRLLSQGVPATIIASLGKGGVRSALMVAAASPVETMADLRGRKVAVSFGSTPHIHAVRWLKEAGLRPGQDVTLLNLGTGELEPALAGGQVDGIVYWEPNISQIVGKLGARVVRSGAYTVAVVMRKDFLAAHREAAVRLLAAMRRAVLYMARNKDQVNGWFAEASRVDPGLIHQGSLHTPIYQVEGLADVSLEVTPEILATFQDSADFYLEQGERSERLPVREHVDFELWEEARRRTEADGFDVGAIRVKG